MDLEKKERAKVCFPCETYFFLGLFFILFFGFVLHSIDGEGEWIALGFSIITCALIGDFVGGGSPVRGVRALVMGLRAIHGQYKLIRTSTRARYS